MTALLIDEMPDPPSRSTQSRQEFVIATDDFLSAIQTRVPQMNAQATDIDAKASLVTVSVVSASEAADRAEAAAAFRVSLAFATWANLSAVAGTYAGQSAGVYNDAGTHTDPVVGGTKANEGVYSWSVSPAGWKWAGTGAASAVAWASITGKPSTFTPAAHTHPQSDITNLTTDLAAKAVAGAVGSSGITMSTGKLLGRGDSGTGIIQEITLGAGLSFDGVTLNVSAGGGMVYPASGIPVSSGSGWSSSLAIPSGVLVGSTASQTLTNKTLGTGTVISAGTMSGVTMTGGTIQAGVTVNSTGTVAANSPGFRGMPIGRTASNPTLSDSDMGQTVISTGTTVSIPSTLSVGYAGSVYNDTASAQTVSLTSGTLRLTGTTTTGSRTLAPRGLMFVGKMKSGEIIVSGAGVT